MVTLYSNNCPRCHVLERKLKDKNIEFDLVADEDVMIAKGFLSSPVLEVDGIPMDFGTAVKWVNQRE